MLHVSSHCVERLNGPRKKTGGKSVMPATEEKALC